MPSDTISWGRTHTTLPSSSTPTNYTSSVISVFKQTKCSKDAIHLCTLFVNEIAADKQNLHLGLLEDIRCALI